MSPRPFFIMSQPKGPAKATRESYEITLPCEPNRFADFISSLLGRPQEIAKTKIKAYRIDKLVIENVYHLVDQRVTQQNSAKLIQFSVTVFFNDGSSVLLNSLEDFLHYNEVRPVISKRVLLHWSFLIQFPDRDAPEKQEIELQFGDGDRVETINIGFHTGTTLIPHAGAAFRIKHTARTWGGDIESLLDNHLDTIALEEGKGRKIVCDNSGWIGLISGCLCFIVMLVAAYRVNDQSLSEKISHAQMLMASHGPDNLDRKVNLIIDELSSGYWQKYTFGFGIYVFGSFIFALIFGITLGAFADNRRKTQVRLTRKAEEAGDLEEAKWQRGWRYMALTIILGVASGLVGNYLYARFTF